MIGPTGSGKTTLAVALLDVFPTPWRVAFSTKRRGKLLEELEPRGYVRLPSWTPITDPDVCPRVLLAPPLRKGVESKPEQRAAFAFALQSIFRQGGWLVYSDEFVYICKHLGLAEDVELLLLQGRELGVTMIQGVQRPRNVPLSAYDQATHLFFFENADGQTLKRLEELVEGVGPETAELVRSAVNSLHSHSLVYVNPRTGQVVRTKVGT